MIIFVILCVLTVISIRYSGWVLITVEQGIAFLIKTTLLLSQNKDFSTEYAQVLEDNANIINEYLLCKNWMLILLWTLLLNIIGLVTMAVITKSSLALTMFLFAASMSNASAVITVLKYRKFLWRMNGVCVGYNVILQSLQYIEIESKENQKDG